MSKRIFSIIFLIIAIVHLFARLLPGDWTWIHYVSKSAIMISLGVFFLNQTLPNWSRYQSLLLGAILFSLAGDIWLMLPGDYFIPGLISFLIAHIFYIILFRKHKVPSINADKSILRQKPWLILPFIAYALLLMWILYPSLGEMLIPVGVYAVIITLMAITALNRWRRTSQNSFLYVFIGAILFVISDSFIAINKFAFDIPLVDFWVMSTYIAAQYLIVMGILMEKQ